MLNRLLGHGFKTAALGLFTLWTIVPIALVISNSFKREMDIFTKVPKLFFTPTMDNYVNVFLKGDFSSYFSNSALVAIVSTFIAIIFGTLAAYGLVGFSSRWSGTIANGFLLGKLVPAISMLLPLFTLVRVSGLLGTLTGPIIAHAALNLPFIIWLMMGFIRDVPTELSDAAKIDGCTPMQTFWKIIVPIILPGMAAAFILAMQYSWNELLFSMQLTSMDTYTLPVGISTFVGAISVDWGKSSAAATITMLPMIIIGFFVQKYIATGTTSGAVKG
ncbi:MULTISPECIES: carbohydrate ABC transporter permease [unclassified Paenibacillus]|uniref:carbohydrate ABC transporter permease n=1 Tax=unclassified Paenibacillus TaxID=185978 RepID=UPI00363F5DB4